MSLMVTEVYDAFRAANVPEEQARRAAQAVAVADTRFEKIEVRLASVEADIRLLKWMTGATFAGVFSLVLKAFV